MKSKLLLAGFLFLATHSLAMAQPPNDLSGIAFILDPGHSQNDNVGIYGYSEANKVLDVAFHLREFLRSSKADTVGMTRTDRFLVVSLTQRRDFTNNFAHPNKWFHSIHSDAGGTTANSILILISDNCATTTGKICQSRWGNTTISMGNSMSDLMARTYRISTRGVYGDRSFGTQFGTNYANSGLGVFSSALQPGTLSEGGFHTNPRQNLLNMNNESKRSEAKAIWMAMLAHFGVTRPPIRTLVGVISDVETGSPINGATVTTSSKTYKTNTYDDTFKPYVGADSTLGNGYYYFEDLTAGAQTVRHSAPGYVDSMLTVSVIDSFFTFQDVKLVSLLPPRVLSSFPVKNQTGVLPNVVLSVTFSRPILRSTGEANMYLLSPGNVRVSGAFTWSNGDQSVSFKPSTILIADTTYRFVIGALVRDLYNHPFDGNGDGVGGDSLVISFRTRTADVTPPAILTAQPGAGTTVTSPNHVINITFDEPLDPTSVNLTNVAIQEIGGSVLSRTLQYSEQNRRGAINIFPTNGLTPGKSYRVRMSGVKDLDGNAISTSSPILYEFSIASSSFQFTSIDDFNTTINNWWAPGSSGSTTGIDSASFTRDTIVTLPTLPSNTGSARLQYYWRTAAFDWLIREYLGGGSPRSVLWTKTATRLQVYVHGDGSGTLFRFAVDDSVDVFPGGTAANHEVSEWLPINWVGWRLVEWDLENDPVGSWLGNRKLEGTLRFDSFQLKYVPGSSAPSGQIYFDHLQLAKGTVTSVQRLTASVPEAFELYQNYPNPFNPETRIEYSVRDQGFVRINVIDLLGRTVRTLVSESHLPGRYAVMWDGRDENGRHVASGAYLYRMQSSQTVVTRKMTLLK